MILHKVGWKEILQGETILSSDEFWSYSILPVLFMHLITNSRWKEKKSVLATGCIVRHMSRLLADLRTPLVMPPNAYLSPKWSHSTLTMHSPVSLAQGFASGVRHLTVLQEAHNCCI